MGYAELKKYTVKLFALFFAFTLLTFLMAAESSALEPPRSGEIEQLKQSGEFYERLEFAKSLGNHQIIPSLLQNAQARILGETETPPGNVDMPSTGNIKTLTILIAFSDYAFTNAASFIDNELYGAGTAGNFPMESLSNYYSRSSYNQLDLSNGNTLGWYTTSYPRSDVAQNYLGREALIKEVLNYYNGQGHDFSQYDNDGDGDVDYLIVIWTGPDNGWGNFWWGYQTYFGDSLYRLDGKSFGTYSWQWESRPAGGTFYPTVVIHETGHALGLPDYYDYDDAIGPDGGVGYLDIMDGNKGDHNAFSKWMLDWLTPTIVPSGSQNLSLGSLSNYGDAVMIMPGATNNVFTEYFIVDNRYQTGNDSNMPGSGVLIWHVDARLSGGFFIYNNSNTSHKLLRLMEADGLEEIETGDGEGDAGDYYTQGQIIGPDTFPDSSSYDGGVTNVSVSNISAAAAFMSAEFAIIESNNIPPGITITQPDGVSDTADTSYTVQWTDSDPDDDASISLYYDPDSGGANGTLIVAGLSEDSTTDSYVWDTSVVPNGSYYVYAVISDAVNQQVLDYSSGTVTISHAGTDDNYEENDAISNAYDLSGYENYWLSSINGFGVHLDSDWYRVFVDSGSEKVQVDCRFTHIQGDIDIALYDSYGIYLVSSNSVTDNEYIDYTVSLGGTYYIHVYYGNAGNTYDLWWDDIQPTNEAPTITINQPDGINDSIITGSSYPIIWTDSDPDNNASISLYYDTNNSGLDGTLIVSGLSEDSANYYNWATTGVPTGSYYIYGVISDGVNPSVSDYSSGMLKVLPVCALAICNPSFEDDLDYWSKNGTPNNTISTDAVDGVKSLRSEHTRTTAQGPAWSGVYQKINSVQPAQTYGIGMWIKSQNAAQGHVKIKWYNSGGTVSQVDYPIININGTMGWTSFSKLVTSPADAVTAEIAIWHGINTSSQNVLGSTIWVDNIEFDVATSACGTLCNESFEQGLLYWTVSGAVGSHNIETTGSHEGLKAARSEQLYTSGDAAKWAGITQYAQVKAGTTYRFRFWLKKNNLNSGHVRIRWRNSSGSLLSTEYPLSGINGTTATWYKREVNVNAPASAAKAEISIWHGVNAGVNVPGSTMWIDNITMICQTLCNGGFEDGMVHWEANGKNEAEVITTNVQEGSQAMRVAQNLTPSDQTQWAGISQRTKVTGGTTYNLSIWVYKWNTVQGHVKIKWRDSNDQLVLQEFPKTGMNGTDTTWIRPTMTVIAPANAETVEIFIWHGVDGTNQNATGSTLYLDNITLVQNP